MPPLRRPTPSYLHHSQSGRARAVWTDRFGVRHNVLLPGSFGSDESRKAYARLLLEMESEPDRDNHPGPDGLTINELLLVFPRFAAGQSSQVPPSGGRLATSHGPIPATIPSRVSHTAPPSAGPGSRRAAGRSPPPSSWRPPRGGTSSPAAPGPG